MLREYLQYLILKILFSGPFAEKMQFIGGTAIRILHGNQRFSEDLDFDNTQLSEQDFDAMIEHVVYELGLYGLQTEWSVSHKGAMHGMIKFTQVLVDYGLAHATRTEAQEKLKIRIDTHDQGWEFEPARSVVQGFGISSVILSAPKELLMAQKILTIGQRKRAKGRDYYDLVYLMSQQVTPDWEFLTATTNIKDTEGLKEYLIHHYTEAGGDYLHRDVSSFLFNSHDDTIRNFLVYIEEYGKWKK